MADQLEASPFEGHEEQNNMDDAVMAQLEATPSLAQMQAGVSATLSGASTDAAPVSTDIAAAAAPTSNGGGGGGDDVNSLFAMSPSSAPAPAPAPASGGEETPANNSAGAPASNDGGAALLPGLAAPSSNNNDVVSPVDALSSVPAANSNSNSNNNSGPSPAAVVAPASSNSGVSSGLSSFSAPKPSVNDEALRKWKEEHKQKLEKMAAASKERQEKEAEQAEKDRQVMYDEWNARKASIAKKNDEEEANFLSERSSSGKGDNSWQKVRSYVDLKGISGTGGKKDISRMREVLIKQWHQ